ncbi:hypothetical protein BJY01DRAFT_241408 [Aspergillus pseudoustus]|uniref:HAD-like domain-containing protein n=1 Tax=Aspergillus pseudoustus TaxID=1810923 RepID=A0ABR4IF05_9EURO
MLPMLELCYQILDAYNECERIQHTKTPEMKYADLVDTIYPQMAARLDLPEPTPEESAAFDQSSFKMSNAGSLGGFPFDLFITAEEVGSSKPDPRNFAYMLRVVYQNLSQYHAHHAAKNAGIRSSWIVRQGSIMGNLDEHVYDWRFDTLGDMANAFERGV